MLHTRRDFLRAAVGTSTLLSLGSVAPDWLLRSAASGRATRRPRHGPGGPPAHRRQRRPEHRGSVCGRRVRPKPSHPASADERAAQDRLVAGLPSPDGGVLEAVQGRLLEPSFRAWAVRIRTRTMSGPCGCGTRPIPQRPQRQTGWLGRVVDRAWSPTAPDTDRGLRRTDPSAFRPERRECGGPFHSLYRGPHRSIQPRRTRLRPTSHCHADNTLLQIRATEHSGCSRQERAG